MFVKSTPDMLLEKISWSWSGDLALPLVLNFRKYFPPDL